MDTPDNELECKNCASLKLKLEVAKKEYHAKGYQDGVQYENKRLNEIWRAKLSGSCEGMTKETLQGILHQHLGIESRVHLKNGIEGLASQIHAQMTGKRS